MTEHNFRPFPTPPPRAAALLERLDGSRTEKFTRITLALDCAAGSCQAEGEESYARYIEDELMPFVEDEREKAAEEEGLIPLLRWEESLFTAK